MPAGCPPSDRAESFDTQLTGVPAKEHRDHLPGVGLILAKLFGGGCLTAISALSPFRTGLFIGQMVQLGIRTDPAYQNRIVRQLLENGTIGKRSIDDDP